MIIKSWFSFFILGLSWTTEPTQASVPFDRPLADIYEQSDLVVRGKIQEFHAECGDGSICSPVKYSLRILETYKSNHNISDGDIIVFCAHAALAIDGNYVFFINVPGKNNYTALPESYWRFNNDSCPLRVMHDGMFLIYGKGSAYRIWSGTAFDVIEDNSGEELERFLTFGIETPQFLDKLVQLMPKQKQ